MPSRALPGPPLWARQVLPGVMGSSELRTLAVVLKHRFQTGCFCLVVGAWAMLSSRRGRTTDQLRTSRLNFALPLLLQAAAVQATSPAASSKKRSEFELYTLNTWLFAVSSGQRHVVHHAQKRPETKSAALRLWFWSGSLIMHP